MGFNYGRATRKFNVNWSTLTTEYAAAGMSVQDIQALREHDWNELKSERNFYTHNQSFDEAIFPDGGTSGEDRSPLLKRHLERMSVSQPEASEWERFAWVEDIDTPELAQRLKLLSHTDLELISYLVVDDLNQAELSRNMGVSRAAISKRIARIRKFLEKDLREG